jgi:hypothetical protein
MSGYQAFASFCNAMKEALEDTGITLTIERGKANVPPYLFMEDGPDSPGGTWRSARMCQGALVLEHIPGQAPLQVRMGRALDTVINASKKLGTIPKYDYSVEPALQTGFFMPKYFELSPELSGDPQRSRRVITWVLYGQI